VLQDEFHARDAIRLVQAERVTVLNGVLAMFHLMMRDASFDRNHLRTLRGGVTADGSVPTDLVDRVRDWCNVERSTTVGRPLPGVEVNVVDFVTGVPHGPEAVGEIAVRGPNVMLGYARMPAETRRSFTPKVVDDVCVIGVPHDLMGQPVCACIGPVPDLARFFDAFPTTGSSTVNRRELERMVALDHTAIMGSS
jgi:fatty-acyl-CoA synthase